MEDGAGPAGQRFTDGSRPVCRGERCLPRRDAEGASNCGPPPAAAQCRCRRLFQEGERPLRAVCSTAGSCGVPADRPARSRGCSWCRHAPARQSRAPEPETTSYIARFATTSRSSSRSVTMASLVATALPLSFSRLPASVASLARALSYSLRADSAMRWTSFSIRCRSRSACAWISITAGCRSARARTSVRPRGA